MRGILLKIHLWLGLSAAVFLVILGLTGSIIAFESDIEHLLHPALWFVTPGPRVWAEEDLVRAVEDASDPVRVRSVQIFRQRNLAQLMQLEDGSSAFISPYDGAIRGRVKGPSSSQKMLGFIHQIHLRLVPVPRDAPTAAALGKVIVNFAGLFLCLLAPTGLILWWRTKRASIQWSGSWFRVCFDAHNALGIYAGLFVFIAAFTGVLIGFDFGEEAIYSLTGSSRPELPLRALPSTPVPGVKPIYAGQAMSIALAAMPAASVAVLQLPLNPKASFVAQMRLPEETSETVHSYVVIDQYSGRVLQVRNFQTDSQGYRVIRFNRSIHTGDVGGTFTHILVSVSSLLLVAMVLTGFVIWWKKLAV